MIVFTLLEKYSKLIVRGETFQIKGCENGVTFYKLCVYKLFIFMRLRAFKFLCVFKLTKNELYFVSKKVRLLKEWMNPLLFCLTI